MNSKQWHKLKEVIQIKKMTKFKKSVIISFSKVKCRFY